ncbi:MAG: ParB/RepB/Spo0J family partition protein [Verrucomicrobia bacterium]|nr:ParB/RepB/Spo0J family partition protein [Verrucomicrobiota bacterium]MCH8512951.1 ParB/RepB/Spo0J family partition protein [Kiritimatiellia bacterium]
MATKKSGLGRGLNALITQGGSPADSKKPVGDTKPVAKSDSPSKTPPPPEAVPDDTPHEVAIHLIVANPWQPRASFDEEALEELAASIREMGVLSPLLVRRRQDDASGYQLIAGERRFRAAQRAGLKKVPVIVRDLTDQEALEIALVENLQRRDLNIIEEAEGYQRLAADFHLTQEAIAKRVGKGRATVANALRMLSLAPDVRTMVADGRLSTGHAKVLLSLEIEDEQIILANACLRERWSVRELERQVKARLNPPRKPTVPEGGKADIPPDHLQYLIDRLHQRLGTSVRISPTRSLANGKKQRGKLEIDFYSNDDLDRLLELFGLAEEI